MKNKNGFLLAEETLKMVIAIIAILFLVYLLVSVYLSAKTKKELELAKASLENLITEANSGNTIIQIYNPKNWFILSWPHDTASWDLLPFPRMVSNSGTPKTCENLGWSKCLCICDGDTQNSCDDNGICFENNLEVKDKEIKLENLPVILEIKNGVIEKK